MSPKGGTGNRGAEAKGTSSLQTRAKRDAREGKIGAKGVLAGFEGERAKLEKRGAS